MTRLIELCCVLIAFGCHSYAWAQHQGVAFPSVIVAVPGNDVDVVYSDPAAEMVWVERATDEMNARGWSSGAVAFRGADGSERTYTRGSAIDIPLLFGVCRAPCDSDDDMTIFGGGSGADGGFSGGGSGGGFVPYDPPGPVCYEETYQSCYEDGTCVQYTELVCP